MKKYFIFISAVFIISHGCAMEYFEDTADPYTFRDICPLDFSKHIALRAAPAAALLLFYSPFYSKNCKGGLKIAGSGTALVAVYSAWTYHTIEAIRAQSKIEKVKNNPLTPIILTYNYNETYNNYGWDSSEDEDIFLQENRDNTLKAFLEKYKDKKFPLYAAFADLEKLKKQAEKAQFLFADSSHYSYFLGFDPTDPSGRKDRLSKRAKDFSYKIAETQDLIQKSEEWKKEQQNVKTLSSKIWRLVESKI